ncbi:O-antigen ligase [Maritimibacter sp. DP1N21-5]|uniref:O-antigen ligase family protein n=1 Tax=Maritimibacter sp. DP1N21-5 TaxID=2836867 RepID=UPI001C4844E0|nr:O-antigen ligase family protein [Maritimibacter sp. DP1N21-5]MBV7407499.1 O-antigen ligase family protein [Maritimibacter sp. DP1N21-5]
MASIEATTRRCEADLAPSAGALKTFRLVKTLLAAGVILSVVQLFLLPVAGVHLSAAFLVNSGLTLIMLLGILSGRVQIDGVSLAYAALVTLTLTAALWSPDPMLALRSALYITAGFGIFAAFRYVVALQPAAGLFALKLVIIGGLAHALLVITFRLAPGVEDRFLHSGIARLLIGQNALAEHLTTNANNIKDPTKAGGLFLNGNIGAMYSEALLFASLALRPYVTRKALWSVVSVLHGAAIVASGSKAALAVVTLFLMLALIFRRYTSRPRSLRSASEAILFLTMAAGIVALLAGVAARSEIGADAGINAMRRGVLFAFAWQEFLDHPLLGHGFGGWAEAFASYGSRLSGIGIKADFPPHNTFIYGWSQGGLALLAAYVAIFAAFFRLAFGLARKRDPAAAQFGVFMIFAGLALTFHSMGENVIFFEEARLQVIFALFLGWASVAVRSTD